MTDLEQFIATCEAHAVPDNEIDFSDIPELTDEQIAQMMRIYWSHSKQVVKDGKRD